MSPSRKYQDLLNIIARAEGAVLAFSGGVDSTFLAHAAKEALGDKALAVTISTPYIMSWEVAQARELATQMRLRHQVVEMPFPEELRNNPPEHCYVCKKILFTKLIEIAEEQGHGIVLEGTNVDDLGDYRPGIKALGELGVKSPLMEAGLGKQEIRDLSRKFGLATWDKPSFACLMSRLPVDTPVTDQDLRMVEQAEVALMKLGFKAVRVRKHGDVARLEIPSDRITEAASDKVRQVLDEKLKDLGFRHVALDLAGYRMGSLNKIITEKKNER